MTTGVVEPKVEKEVKYVGTIEKTVHSPFYRFERYNVLFEQDGGTQFAVNVNGVLLRKIDNSDGGSMPRLFLSINEMKRIEEHTEGPVRIGYEGNGSRLVLHVETGICPDRY